MNDPLNVKLNTYTYTVRHFQSRNVRISNVKCTVNLFAIRCTYLHQFLY